MLATSATGLFDRSQFRRVFFSGTVSRTLIKVYDHERRCYISGAGDGSHFVFFHAGEHCHVSLDIYEGAFGGHDYGRSTPFRGTLEGRQVTFHELDSDLRFRYSL